MDVEAQIISVSNRDEDNAFAKEVAEINRCKYVKAPTANELRMALKASLFSVVLWDADHKNTLEGSAPNSFQHIGQILRQFSLPSRQVFVITDEPLNKTPYLFNYPAFDHHIYRRYDPPAAQLFGYLAKASLWTEVQFGLEGFVPPKTDIKKLVLKRSGERKPVIQAIENILGQKGVPPKLCVVASQAIDELLMNAIFDAPVADDYEYRRHLERTKDFELLEREKAEIEIAVSQEYIALSVTDFFGSLKKEAGLAFIRKDYEVKELKVKEVESSGVGIYGIIKSGLSLLFLLRPGQTTQVVIFVPMVKNFKAFRSAVRFFSFF
jgi:hypothetical protein